MKFFKLLFTILAASSGLTIHTKRELNINLLDYKCFQVLYDDLYKNIECTDLEQKINTKEDLIKFCDAFNTVKCKKYNAIRITDYPECKDSDKYQLNQLQFSYDVNYVEKIQQCAKDEHGNFCPFNNIELSSRIKDTMTEKQIQEEVIDVILKETCKSPKCIDAYFLAFGEWEKLSEAYTNELSRISAVSQDEAKLIDSMFKIKLQERSKNSNVNNINILLLYIFYFVKLIININKY